VSRNEIGRTCPHVPGVSSSRALGQSASHHPLPGTSFPANGQANVYAFYVSFWVISIAPLRQQRTPLGRRRARTGRPRRQTFSCRQKSLQAATPSPGGFMVRPCLSEAAELWLQLYAEMVKLLATFVGNSWELPRNRTTFFAAALGLGWICDLSKMC
jgi:hypothetical protein